MSLDFLDQATKCLNRSVEFSKFQILNIFMILCRITFLLLKNLCFNDLILVMDEYINMKLLIE